MQGVHELISLTHKLKKYKSPFYNGCSVNWGSTVNCLTLSAVIVISAVLSGANRAMLAAVTVLADGSFKGEKRINRAGRCVLMPRIY